MTDDDLRELGLALDTHGRLSLEDTWHLISEVRGGGTSSSRCSRPSTTRATASPPSTLTSTSRWGPSRGRRGCALERSDERPRAVLIVLGACCCGALVAVGVLEYAVWRMERDDGRWR